MTEKEIEDFKIEAAAEFADALLQNAIGAAMAYKDELGLTSFQIITLATAHMAASTAYLKQGGV
jgi:hypothetical protein